MNRITKHRSVVAMSAGALAFVLGGFLWAVIALGEAGSAGAAAFVLHFDDVNGITQIGGVTDLAFAGIVAAVFVVINFALALELDVRDRVLGKIMAAATLALAVLIFIACAAIINVNV